jgi:tape measure domain-containing protein
MTTIQYSLSLNDSAWKAAMDKAGRDMLQLQQRMVSGFAPAASQAMDLVTSKVVQIGAAIGSLAAVKGFAQASDAALLMAARMKMVTGSIAEAASAQQQLFQLAQRLQAPIAEVQQSFTRMMPIVREMGGGTQEAIRLSEILVSTAKLSGASAAEASASAMQFAQALGSGTLQGDELRSILENNQVLARTLAESLGVSVGQLKKLGSEGKLTSDKVANALLGSYASLQAQTDQLPETVGGAFTRIENSFGGLVAAMNSGGGVFTGVIAIFNEVAKIVDLLAARFKLAGQESNALERQQGAKNFAQVIGKAISYLVDLVGAVIDLFQLLGQSIGAAVAAIGRALEKDFSGAMAIMEEQGTRNVQIMKDMGSAIMGAGKAVQGYNAIIAAEGISTPSDARMAGQGGKSATLKRVGGDDKKTPEKSRVSEWDAKLDQMRVAFQMENDLREMSKQAEIQYWTEIRARADLTQNEKIALDKKVADATLANLKEMAAQRKAMREEEIAELERAGLYSIQTARQQAQFQVEQGLMTRAELLAQEQQFLEQQLQVQRQALEQRLALLALDPTKNAVAMQQLNNQLLELERQYQMQRREIEQQSHMERMAAEDQLATSISQGAARILTDFKQMGKGMVGVINALFQTVLQSVQQVLAQMLATWIKQQIMMRVFSKTATAGRIGEQSALAGAGGVASMAAAPFPINLSAPAFGASMAAAAMAFAPVASAAGGFDIPAGLNPITQLHAEEMVLPKEQADVIRDMASGGAGGPQVVLQGVSAGDFFIANRHDLERVLRMNQRDNIGGSRR